jgi:hypothetical protein
LVTMTSVKCSSSSSLVTENHQRTDVIVTSAVKPLK